jgi:hypothetical protein
MVWRDKHAAAIKDRKAAETDVANARAELAAAETEHARCQNAYDAAVSALRSAEIEESNAQQNLFQAESALAMCRSRDERDSQGRRVTPNCSGYEIGVMTAQSRLDRARHNVAQAVDRVNVAERALNLALQRVQAAQTWLARAHAWLVKAQAREKLCQERVGAADILVRDAERTQDRAAVAVRLSNQTLLDAAEAIETGEKASETGDRGDREIRLAADHAGHGTDRVAAADTATAEIASSAAQHIDCVARASRDLDDGAELLARYDAPDLNR